MNRMISTRPCTALLVNRISFLSCREKQRLALHLDSQIDDSPQAESRAGDLLSALGPEGMSRFMGRRIRPDGWKPASWQEGARQDAAWLERQGGSCLGSSQGHRAGILILDEPGYPELLQTLGDAPYLLFFRGNIASVQEPAVAVVGTRNPSLGGRRGAFRLAAGAAKRGCTVVSGLARGIDGEAHWGALSASGQNGCGTTAAVLGTGLDCIYPGEHRWLASEILKAGGLLLSEYPPGTPPRRWNFPARNRIISGLSRTVVVAEAPLRSGALITADFALEQGRDMMVLREGLFSGAAGGCRRLEEEGAPVVESFQDIEALWAGGEAGVLSSQTSRGWQIEEDPGDGDGGGKEEALTASWKDPSAIGAEAALSLEKEMSSLQESIHG